MFECRLCLQIGPSIYVFDESRGLPGKIWNCCGLMVVQNDGLPKQICFSCEIKLNSFTEFKHICVQNEIVLKQRSKEINDEIEERKISLDIYDRSDLNDNTDVFQDSDEDTVKSVLPSHDTVWFECFSNDSIPAENSQNNEMCIAKKYNCNECGKLLSSLSSLKNHTKRMHKNRKCEQKVLKGITKRTLIKRETETEKFSDATPASEDIFLNVKREKIKIDTNDSSTRGDINRLDTTNVLTLESESFLKQTNTSDKHCNKLYKSKIDHNSRQIRDDKRETFKCDICNKIFKHRRNLTEHVKRHMNLLKTIPCDRCDFKAENNNKLRRHINVKHLNNGNHECGICKKTLSSKKCLDYHIKRVHDDKQNFFECDICNKTFTQRGRITQHLKRHMIPKYPCDKCNFVTKCNNKLLLHIDGKHSNHPCRVCGKVFGSRRNCNNHIKQIHEKLPNIFECDICPKTFSAKYKIAEHLKRHMNLMKKFPCDLCAFKAENRNKLRQHIEGKHLNIKKYQCSICGKLFNSRSTCQTHLKVHDSFLPFQCDYCGKYFKTKFSIRLHILIHLGIKRYKCHYCSKRFSGNTTLKAHILQHTGENPFSCELCQKGFKQRSNLKSHLRHFHKQT